MYLYLIKQDVNNNYDTYDSAIVIATSEEEAKTIHPDGSRWDGISWAGFRPDGSWCNPENITVRLIGFPSSGEVGDVVVASFNAG